MQLKKVKLGYVKCEEKISQTTNRPWYALSIKVEGNDTWFNGFGAKRCQSWNQGDEVFLVFFEDEWNGEKKIKVRLPNNEDVLSFVWDRLNPREEPLPKVTPSPKVTTPQSQTPEVELNDLPF